MKIPTIDQKILDRFNRYVSKKSDSECWLWTGTVAGDGYGVLTIMISRTKWYAFKVHRLAYFIATETDPEGYCVCHSCDVPLCCNPRHLWLGTNVDNTRDRTKKYRSASGAAHGTYTHPEKRVTGEKNGNATLPDAVAEQIRGEYTYPPKNGHSSNIQQLSEKYKVSRDTIYRIVKRLNRWSHV